MGLGRHGHGHSHNSKHVDDHGHSHKDHGHSHEGGNKKFLGCCLCTDVMRLSFMLCMTFVFFLVELIVGQITKSISLTTDSFHMLSDAFALLIGLFTAIISKRKSNKNTFGWVRAEVLGPLINSVFLVSLCLGIVIEAVERLFEPKEIKDINLLLYVGILGLIINLAGLFVFGHGHSHNIPKENESDDSDDDDDDDNESSSNNLKEIISVEQKDTEKHKDNEIKFENPNDREQKPLMNYHDKNNVPSVNQNDNNKNNEKNNLKEQAKKPKKARCHILSNEANMNMRAVFLHVLADALGSVIVIISALLNKFQDQLNISKKFIDLIDPILCLCLVALILSTALPLLKESALILLQTVPKEIEVKKLKKELVEQISGVSAVHELHIWKLSGRKIIATAHVMCHNSEEYMQIAAKIKEFFHKKGIHSTTIQPEFTDLIEGETPSDSCVLECMKNCHEHTCCGQNTTNNPTNANVRKTSNCQLKNISNQECSENIPEEKKDSEEKKAIN